MYVNGTRTSIPQMNALQIEKLAEKLKVGTYERWEINAQDVYLVSGK